MSNTPELRFQGLCLMNEEGYKYMCDCYDKFPELVRDRLKSSNYNLCAACVRTQARNRSGCHFPDVPHYLSVISWMEAELKRDEGIGGQE